MTADATTATSSRPRRAGTEQPAEADGAARGRRSAPVTEVAEAAPAEETAPMVDADRRGRVRSLRRNRAARRRARRRETPASRRSPADMPVDSLAGPAEADRCRGAVAEAGAPSRPSRPSKRPRSSRRRWAATRPARSSEKRERRRRPADPPVQDPGSHQAPADPAGAGRQGRARQQGRGAHHLPVAGRPLLRADAQRRPWRRHLAARSPTRPTASG